MTAANLFGTDGIRDRAGEGALTSDSVSRLGTALACFVREGRDASTPPRILFGRDTRLSGPEIESTLADALTRRHCDVDSLGIVPTPAVSQLVRDHDYDLGIVISASHNPPDFNGIKVFDAQGQKLDVEREERITALYHDAPSEEERAAVPTNDRSDLVGQYLGGLDRSFGAALGGLRVVLDCGHGATSEVAQRAFEAAGAEVVQAIHTELDGSRINVDCGSTNPEAVGRLVVEAKANLGVAFDGDGDRAIMVDETGAVVDGDEVMALWALSLRDDGELPNDLLVTTVMSNAGMESYLVEKGVRLIRTSVGDREVFQAMETENAVLGGEQSGHIIDRRFGVTGDGIRTGMAVAQLIASAGRPLSELRAPIPRFPQVLLGVQVEEKVAFDQIPGLTGAVDEVEKQLDGRGRLLLRYSGTEPLARVLVEGPDPEENTALAEKVADAIRSQ